jgi:hypothetical protein
MKKQLCLVSALGIVHCTSFASFAEPAQQIAAPTANSALNEQSKKIEKDCEDEWRANQEAMMKGDMTEDSYVQQCIVKDDVPAIPEPKTKAAPSSAPK